MHPVDMSTAKKYKFDLGAKNEDADPYNIHYKLKLKLHDWITAKVTKMERLTERKTRGKSLSEAQLEKYSLPNVEEIEMDDKQITIVSKAPDCTVIFKLNQRTGDIEVKYESEDYGGTYKKQANGSVKKVKAGGNPWWCVAEARTAESSRCGDAPEKISLLPEGDPHSKSIKEYLTKNFVFPRPPTVPASSTKPSRFNFYLPGQVMNRKTSKTRKNNKNRKSTRKNN